MDRFSSHNFDTMLSIRAKTYVYFLDLFMLSLLLIISQTHLVIDCFFVTYKRLPNGGTIDLSITLFNEVVA